MRAIRRTLEQRDCAIAACYGAHFDIARPQFLVPLETPAGARHFYQTLYVPYSRPAALVRRSARLLAALRLQRLLFRDIILIARKAENSTK